MENSAGMNNHVTSKDGTSIAYDRQGSGPAVILVGGGFDDGSENAPLATELAKHLTVYNYARRGRGDSGDTLPYALEREIEDIEALIAEAGGSAHLFGVSSGGALALEAAAAGLAIDRLAVYEAPYTIGVAASQRWQEYVEQLGPALANASNLVLCHRHATHNLLTLDERQFRATLGPDDRPLRLLPADRQQ
jgi:pimeloyl-ACP methyl ester carboxylesterase